MNRLLSAALVCGILASLPAGATRVERLSPAQLRDEAAAILIVDVLSASTRVGQAGMRWTDYLVQVAEDVRDGVRAGETLTLPFANDIAGVPVLRPGERYAIFVDDAPGRPMPVVGWTQGLFRVEGDRLIAMDAAARTESCTCGGFAAVPVAWEIEHAEADYRAAAMATFDYWNRYIDVFRPRVGDGTMAPNGVNEIGFLDRATLSARYGINIDRHVFAITFMTPLSAAGDFDGCPRPAVAVCGTFTETDVILNSEFIRGYRASGPVDYTDTAPALYGATAAHELGHALGFHHNVQNVSVMNLYEDFAAQYIAAADAREARRAYPSRARPLRDLAAYPFTFNPRQMDYAATQPLELMTARVARGGAVAFRNFGIENAGTETAANVRLDLYLSADDAITTSDLALGTIEYGVLAPGEFRDDDGSGRALVLPSGIPAGTYYLGAILRSDAADELPANDVWLAPGRLTVTGAGARRRAVRQ